MCSTVTHDDKFIILKVIDKFYKVGEQVKHLLLLKFQKESATSQKKLETDIYLLQKRRRRRTATTAISTKRKEDAESFQSKQSVTSHSSPQINRTQIQICSFKKGENEKETGYDEARLRLDYDYNCNKCDCDCDCDYKKEWSLPSRTCAYNNNNGDGRENSNWTYKNERRKKEQHHHHLKLLHIFVILMISFILEKCSSASASPFPSALQFSFSPSTFRPFSSHSNAIGGRPKMYQYINHNSNKINNGHSKLLNEKQSTVTCTRDKYNQNSTNSKNVTIKCRLVLNSNSLRTLNKNSTITIPLSRQIINEISGNLTQRSGNSRTVVALDVHCQPQNQNGRFLSVSNQDGKVTEEHKIKTLFNFSELSKFLPRLESISIIGCKLSDDSLLGSLPRTLLRLDLSNNSLESLNETLFSSSNRDKDKGKWVLTSINLTGNEDLQSLPASLLNMTSVTEVWINQHNMSCPWVVRHLYHWHENNVLRDADKSQSLCRSDSSDKAVNLTLYGALKAKQDEIEECKKLDVNCSCSIYTVQLTHTLQRINFPVSFQIKEENVSITLKVDCSFRGLKKLPKISPLTKVLNVSHNEIKNLNELKTPEYRNLGTLDAEFNQIESIDSINGTCFIGQFDVFGLSHNSITSLPKGLMSVLLDSDEKGHRRISLGHNYIDCDCDTAKDLKFLLAKHQKQIADAKRLYCRNEEPFIKVQELDLQKVCVLEDGNEDNLKWYIIIIVEVLLILLILLKVGWDSRQYRETGILPWCSSKIPRLPCDFMLDGIKEGPNTRCQNDK